jgi:hypothetical protein
MSKRTYLTREIDKRVRRAAELEIPIAIGGGTVLATPQHALDGPEHTEPTDLTVKDATVDHHGLLPKPSGAPTDVLHGDLAWGPEAAATLDHGALTGLNDDDHIGVYRTVYGGGQDIISVHSAAGAAETLDLADGNVQDVTLTADCTVSLSGAVAGVACDMALLLRQGGLGSYEVTWPGSVVWVGGSAPTLETAVGAWDWVSLTTLDGGTVWFAAHGGTSEMASSGHYEVIMAEGIDTPPEPVSNEAGDDWVYGWVTD